MFKKAFKINIKGVFNLKNVRLDKFLSEKGICSRSEAKIFAKKGFITINGVKETKSDVKIDPLSDVILFKGEEISKGQKEYYMLYKPAGVVSATEDKKEKTVLDLIPKPYAKDIAPVGRLDKDTEGLLLITNDGELNHNLLSPKKHVDKTYFVRVKGLLGKSDVEAVEKGIDIGDEKDTLPAKLNIISSGEESECEITIHEGRFHQIKRMFKALGKEVIYLKRLSMGSLVLDESIGKGGVRRLTEEEIKCLKGEIKNRY